MVACHFLRVIQISITILVSSELMKVIHALVDNITINYLVIVLIMCVFFGTGRYHFCPWPILCQHFDGQTQFLGHLFG